MPKGLRVRLKSTAIHVFLPFFLNLMQRATEEPKASPSINMCGKITIFSALLSSVAISLIVLFFILILYNLA